MVHLGVKVVSSHDIGRDVVDPDAHVFILFHWCVQVEILYVGCTELGVWCGEDTVEEAFYCGEVRGFGCYWTIVLDPVSAYCQTNSFLDLFVWAILRDDACICGCLVGWDLCFGDKEEGIGSAVRVGIVSLGALSYFVTHHLFPFLSFGVAP